jgi:flagellar motor switch protein FliM
MSNLPPHTLTQQKLQQLLAAARFNRAPSSANADAPKYNWNQPRYFDRNQLGIIAAAVQGIAAAFSSALASFGRSGCSAAAADTTQHFAADLLPEFSAQPQFHAAIVNDQNNSCGFVSVSAASAREMLAKLLGDTEPLSDSQHSLSGLENSLLQDITAALVNSLSHSIKQAGGPSLRRAADIAEGNPVFDCSANSELCRISFNVSMQNVTAVFHVVFAASALRPLVEKAQNIGATTSGQFQQTILTHIKPVPLAVNARVASASLRLSDVFALEEGDIIVLDKQITEPIELLLRDTPAFEAHLGTEAGKYAMVIVEPSSKPVC